MRLRKGRPISSALRRVRVLLLREDVRRSPLRALLLRVVWHLRWKLYPNTPWLLQAHGTFPLLTIQSGVGALIYYQGVSEPETATFLKSVLEPGMVFVDVGAHLGEYTVLAAAQVKPAGYVHAFEPHPDSFEILSRNIKLNACDNVIAHPYAVYETNGFYEFELTPEPSTSMLRADATKTDDSSVVTVEAISLDRYFSQAHLSKPSVIKIDVEGAELLVLRGARCLLAEPAARAPVVIFEYGSVHAQRFGYLGRDIFAYLNELGYRVYACSLGELVQLKNCPTFPDSTWTCNLIAVKWPPRIPLALGKG